MCELCNIFEELCNTSETKEVQLYTLKNTKLFL
jgi:hypothetical protein